MGTITSTSVLARVSTLLNDTENTHWTLDELISWLNDGQREIALYRPSACVRNVDVMLAVGTKQRLPPDGISLVDVPRNTNGTTIRATSRDSLDAIAPDWHSQKKAKAKTEHFCYSSADPKTFYVYPASTGTNSVEIIYNASPAQVSIGGPIAVDDIYASALIDYVLFRAFAKDTDYSPNPNASTSHYQAFLAAIKGQEQTPAPRA